VSLTSGFGGALRGPLGVRGVFVSRVRAFDGTDYARLDKGAEQRSIAFAAQSSGATGHETVT